MCPMNSIWNIREQCEHLFFGLDVELVIFKFHAVLIINIGLSLDAHEDILGSRVAAVNVVGIISCHKRRANIR